MRLADGDRTAFHPVFVALLPLLRRFAARGLSPADAEDAAQEALLKVFRRATEFDRRRDALSWILGIAAYEIKTVRRRRERRREADAPIDLASRPAPAATPEEQAITADLDAAIEAAIATLSPLDASTLRAFAFDERPAGLPPATFRKRLERAIARLRARWKEDHGDR